ncbi:hypothetical protein SKAU_G00271460 [Synaphobranchus kaupii]|uniref:Uncharacterized protein n=1 Tax=Synaphobranchus kaupii TaxID=118154 RepID=A0A9Q1IQF5_SYNKA|nr:hypothetical protein SKAU_G00271460 [Synaphobranchus kaupii]
MTNTLKTHEQEEKWREKRIRPTKQHWGWPPALGLHRLGTSFRDGSGSDIYFNFEGISQVRLAPPRPAWPSAHHPVSLLSPAHRVGVAGELPLSCFTPASGIKSGSGMPFLLRLSVLIPLISLRRNVCIRFSAIPTPLPHHSTSSTTIVPASRFHTVDAQLLSEQRQQTAALYGGFPLIANEIRAVSSSARGLRRDSRAMPGSWPALCLV